MSILVECDFNRRQFLRSNVRVCTCKSSTCTMWQWGCLSITECLHGTALTYTIGDKMNKYFAKFSLVKPQEIFLRYRSDAARERMVTWNRLWKQMHVSKGESLKFSSFYSNMRKCSTSFSRIRGALMTKCVITLMAFSSPPSCKMYADALQLHFDDLEPTNPLGSKLGAVHFNLKNLPPDCNSSISNTDLTRFWKSLMDLMDGFRWLENSAVELKGRSH